MEITLKILISADPALLAAITGLHVVSGTQAPVVELPQKSAKQKPAPTPAASTASATEEKTGADATKSEASTASTHSLESLRAIAVPKSKAGHKDVIKKWLTDNGFPSLQDLSVTSYDDFYAFITKL